MITKSTISCFFLALVLVLKISAQETFFENELNTNTKPWTEKTFKNDPQHFQFAIVTDRTGGHRPGIFGRAVERLNLLQPEFVMSVGDLIEGYSKQLDTLDRQWAEFDQLLTPLEMKFFFLPGNHDISNEVMREKWIERHGQSYYHFLYKDVLFLAMDTNDGDDDATFSKDQIEYFKKAINDHPEARWTLVFMHHPVWLYPSLNGFDEIESLLVDRPYTVFAGHFHRYIQTTRQDRNYYVLSTTGGGSRLRGAKFGEFDHVTWVTMTDDGPKVLNLALDGMIKDDVSTIESMKLSRALIEATQFNTLFMASENQEKGQLHFNITNTGTDTIFFDGRLFHHHQLRFDQSKISFAIPPNGQQTARFSWEQTGELPLERFDPVELNFSIGYRTGRLDLPYQLDGQFITPLVLQEEQVTFSEPDVFMDNLKVRISHPFPDVSLRYTLNGETPTAAATEYQGPIEIDETATIKVAFFDPSGQAGTTFLEKEYRKVMPMSPVSKPGKKTGLTYQYFEGNFERLPAFEELTPLKSGTAQDFDVETIAGERIDHYAIAYKGFVEVPEDGLYTFYLHSDDGAKLYLHDQVVVDNDGSHSARTRKGFVALEAGVHPIRVEYFEDFLGQVLEVYIQHPGQKERQPLSFETLTH